MSYKSILVTGGAGFIGSHLVDSLINTDHRVVVLDNESTGRRDQVNPQAIFEHGDVRNREDVSRAFDHGIDAVFHIAGQASIKLSFADPADDLAVNVGGTLNVLKACLERGVGRLLYASSMTIYGNPDRSPTPEHETPAPVSYYGITKYAAERYVQTTGSRTDLATPLAVTSLRMFNVFGPRQRLDNPYQGVLAIFLGNVLRGEGIVIHSDGKQSRDFVYIADVCRAWVECLHSVRTHGRVLNVGSGAPTSINTLCDTVLECFGKSRNSYPVSYAEAQQGDIRCSAASIDRISNTLEWQPETPLRDGLNATVRWAKREIG